MDEKKNYQFWKMYFLILCGFTILVFLITPFFYKRQYFLGYFIMDLVCRVFATYCLCSSIHAAIYIDEIYEKFFKGAENVFLDLQKTSNRIIYILFAIGSGIAAFWVYVSLLSLFTPYLNNSKFLISSIFTILIEIPLIFRLLNGKIKIEG